MLSVPLLIYDLLLLTSTEHTLITLPDQWSGCWEKVLNLQVLWEKESYSSYIYWLLHIKGFIKNAVWKKIVVFPEMFFLSNWILCEIHVYLNRQYMGCVNNLLANLAQLYKLLNIKTIINHTYFTSFSHPMQNYNNKNMVVWVYFKTVLLKS